MATQNQERKRMFVGGGLHGLELPVGMTKTTMVSYRLPDEFPSDALRMDEYRTLKLTLRTTAGTKHRRFRVLRGVKRSQALRMTRRELDRFWQ